MADITLFADDIKFLSSSLPLCMSVDVFSPQAMHLPGAGNHKQTGDAIGASESQVRMAAQAMQTVIRQILSFFTTAAASGGHIAIAARAAAGGTNKTVDHSNSVSV